MWGVQKKRAKKEKSIIFEPSESNLMELVTISASCAKDGRGGKLLCSGKYVKKRHNVYLRCLGIFLMEKVRGLFGIRCSDFF